MVDPIEEYQRLKAKVDSLERKADRAQGALDQISRELKEEFEVSSLEEAQALLEELTKREEEEAQEFEQVKRAWLDKWASKLEERV